MMEGHDLQDVGMHRLHECTTNRTDKAVRCLNEDGKMCSSGVYMQLQNGMARKYDAAVVGRPLVVEVSEQERSVQLVIVSSINACKKGNLGYLNVP